MAESKGLLKFEVEAASIPKDTVLGYRKEHFCSAQSVSYANSKPLMIVRGEGAYLYDEEGTAYLDTRNNVKHLGHEHPKFVAAVQRQVAALNINTRYLHPYSSLLAHQFLAKFPKELGKVFFVNSGSEANDLAIRLATAYTKRKHFICVDHGYHGHTVAVIDISPYKFNHPRGNGPPANSSFVSAPNTYRGQHQGSDASVLYANEVKDACAEHKGEVAAFIVESGMSVGGLIIPPEGYLQQCFQHVRDNGGVCIADEVQVGFGRFGTHFWAFEQQGVIPDIVTCGKPFGNGMPLAAVVCTDAIAEAFAEGPEYFNTYGGNPVSCAAGLAVLEIIEEEGLQSVALEVGGYLKSRLLDVAKTQPLIGDVRGSGLFVGIEFVKDAETKTPAPVETSAICTKLMTEHQILSSIDGPDHNIIVMKPPMCFTKDNVDTFIGALNTVMSSLGEIDEAIGHTPT